ncbi:hypothetical protein OCU04_006619 [Sclerotinia nivalis]|uniref:Uncharacterized protein n=1 Tax=Sclerotinia nivalis TaxID=352851 RepID=A0A9X0ANK5_9HELO|nr:hypothetical protein OCU04_006619 [Sclerotinia nivalis]
MWSLLKAFLLAPAIVSAFVLPSSSEHDVDAEFKKNGINSTDAYNMGFVRLDISHGLPSADMSSINLRIDILHSAEACGFGNVTIDGQALSQTFDPETLVSSGKGSVSTLSNKIIVGSWSFDCIVIDGKPHGQLMKFMVDFVEGKAFENIGVSVLFRQTDETEIMNMETFSSKEDQVIEHHSPQGQSSDKQHHNGKGSEGEHEHHMGKGSEEHGHHMGHKDFNIHRELAELKYMKAQLEELQYLIHQKKRHIFKHFQENQNLGGRIRDCDSLRCVARVVSEKVRKFYGKIAGNDFDEEHFHHSFKSQSKKGKKHDKEFHGKLGNHTSGNGDFPGKPHGKNNHTDPHFPHHNRHHILPVCHYPPPFEFHPRGHHHDGPHGPPHKPPPREFSHHGFEHERHSGMHHFQDDEDEGGHWEGRPRHHGGHYGRPHGDNSDEIERLHRDRDGSPHRFDDFDNESDGRHKKHAKPHHGQGPSSFDPDSDRFEEHHHGRPPHAGSFDGPGHERPHHPQERPFDGPEHERPQDPQDEEFHHGPPQDGPQHEDPENQEPEFDSPQHESPSHQKCPEDQPAFPEPPPLDGIHPGPGPHFNGPPPHIIEEGNHGPPGGPHRPAGFPLHILKLTLIGFLFSLLIITLHRRSCNSKARSDHREERYRRRTYRRASNHATFKSWLARIIGREEFEEKDKEALLEDYDSDAEPTSTSTISIGDDITSFRNAVEVVREMVAAEDCRLTPIPAHCASASQAPEHMNSVVHMNSGLHLDGYTNGIEDILPPYEDADADADYDYEGSEEGSLVADGFRYMPGCSAYNPSDSPSGGVSDVLGDKS